MRPFISTDCARESRTRENIWDRTSSFAPGCWQDYAATPLGFFPIWEEIRPAFWRRDKIEKADHQFRPALFSPGDFLCGVGRFRDAGELSKWAVHSIFVPLAKRSALHDVQFCQCQS